MSFYEVTLLLLGVPVSILGIGLRRAMGVRGQFMLVASAVAAGVYGALVLHVLAAAGFEPALGGVDLGDSLRHVAPALIAAVLIGGLGAALLRFRGRGLGDRT